MGLFGSHSEGGLADVIRCDEKEYLIWKWRPSGEANTTKKENSIHWGSSLRVKDGEVAVFVYNQKDSFNQDFIIGPHDDIIKTAAFPVFSSMIDLAYAGKSPFQAEIYFINLAEVIQVNFGVPYFDIFDPRFPDFGVPCAVRGTLTFYIADYINFIKLHRLINFELQDFMKQIRSAVIRLVKASVVNFSIERGVSVFQIESKIEEINELVFQKLKPVLELDFGVSVKRLDVSAVELDKESTGYIELKKITAGITSKTIVTQTDLNRGETGNGSVNPAEIMPGGSLGGQTANLINHGGTNFQNQQSIPPPPPVGQYYVSNNGQQTGPFTIQQIQHMIQKGHIGRNTYIWKQGFANWIFAEEVQEIVKMFN